MGSKTYSDVNFGVEVDGRSLSAWRYVFHAVVSATPVSAALVTTQSVSASLPSLSRRNKFVASASSSSFIFAVISASVGFGVLFPDPHVNPAYELSATENVALGSMILGENKKRSLEKASDILNKFGLAERLNHFPSQLSGGEKQRVAMARALINKPDLIFLDEPTGNLDKDTSKEVIKYLNQLTDEFKSSIIVATHDPEFRNFSDKILTMDSGVFV